MLKKFVLKNYKNFKDEIVLDFGNTAGYKFNTECIHNGFISKAIIYGKNATGKTNFGRAILDIAGTLAKGAGRVNDDAVLCNADSNEDSVVFSYYFIFSNQEVNYEYVKRASGEMISEKLIIDDKLIFKCDHAKDRFSFEGLEYIGADTINKDIYINSRISYDEMVEPSEIRMPFMRWLFNNVAFDSRSTIRKMSNFINRMIFAENTNGLTWIRPRGILSNFAEHLNVTESLEEFEEFLNSMGITCRLEIKKLPDNQYALYFSHKQLVPFFETASSGTLAVTYLYRRIFMNSIGVLREPSFIFLDEFDAFYHYEMAERVVQYFKKNYPKTQILFTTHNTNLMSNRLMRPDCLFILSTYGTLTPLCSATDRELREGHNLEKMYISGEFQNYE